MRVRIIFLFTIFFSASIIAVEPTVTDLFSTQADFTLLYEVPTTFVKNQNRTNTCWSFATTSFIETELLRTQKNTYDLSEMFVVRNAYLQKANKYIRMHGAINFAGGGLPNDVLSVISSEGIVPQNAYSGLLDDADSYNHSEMDIVLKTFVDSVRNNSSGKLDLSWQTNFSSILDEYLGEVPERFLFEGKEYNSETFRDSIKFKPEDYIMLTSFSHHPFYKPFILEIPDNWSWGKTYNLPLDILESVAKTALKKGYSMVWSTDYTETGFMYDKGMALAPRILYHPKSKNEEKKLKEKSVEEFRQLFSNLDNPVEELKITQEIRQEAFDNYSTTDDHGMHIVGLAKDRNGKNYYWVKNSWGTNNAYGGFLFVSDAYFQYKTISIMLHKEALPDNIKTMLEI